MLFTRAKMKKLIPRNAIVKKALAYSGSILIPIRNRKHSDENISKSSVGEISSDRYRKSWKYGCI